jgi:hypothetical protein
VPPQTAYTDHPQRNLWIVRKPDGNSWFDGAIDHTVLILLSVAWDAYGNLMLSLCRGWHQEARRWPKTGIINTAKLLQGSLLFWTLTVFLVLRDQGQTTKNTVKDRILSWSLTVFRLTVSLRDDRITVTLYDLSPCSGWPRTLGCF